jgi:branched-chain amino acid transport system ATP-binding protein
MTPLLAVTDLCAGYGPVKVLNGITFSAERAAIMAVLGANGAGKTTTLRSLIGANRVWSGRIAIDGVDITAWSTERRIREAGLAIVPEGRQLFPELSVRENLLMGTYTSRRGEFSESELVNSLTERFPIIKLKMKHKANSLSGGEQQIVAIGRALMSRPKILLADEVSQGISPVLTLELWKMFRQLAATGTAVVLVEQSVSAALKIADRAIVLKDGKVFEEANAAELANNEKIRLAYLG